MHQHRIKLIRFHRYMLPLLLTLGPSSATFGIITASQSRNTRPYNCRPLGKTKRTSTTMSKTAAAELAEGAEHLFIKTPLIHSDPLSSLVGNEVYLKLDALQSSGSFKVSSFKSAANRYPSSGH